MPDDMRRDVDALERARLEADRRYNDALTAVDRAIVRARDAPAEVTPPPTDIPSLPSGWRGRLLEIVQQWLAPWLAGQHAFNARVAAELNASASRARETAAALEQFETALIVFLQQITAFVDTKVHALDGATSARLADHERRVAALPDVAAQVQTLQRMVQALKRARAEAADKAEAAAPGTSQETTPASDVIDTTYVAFEDRFRGTDEEIREKQSAYLPVFAGASDVLDIGCGRGEFLALLKSAGVSARGIDVNGEMVAVARERGLDASVADALGYVARLPDESLGGVMCAQVVEHLEPAYLIRLLETLSHKMRPDAPAVIETINPACWLAFFSSYIRDFTHVRPIHPETLQYLLQASGFGRVSLRYSAPVPEHVKMAPIELPPGFVATGDPTAAALAGAARVLNANAAILNNLMFSYLDYAAIAARS